MAALLGAALALSGCELTATPKAGEADEPPKADAGGQSESTLGTVSGRVFRADTLAPLAGAKVTRPGGISVTTDKNGTFKLSMVEAARTALLANAEGFAQAVEPVSVRANDTVSLEFRLLPVTATVDIDANEGGQIRATSGAEVVVDKDAFVGLDGKPVSGSVTVELTVLDPSTPEGLQAFPGDFAATSMGGEEGQLESFVPMEITVRQGDSVLDFADGKGAEVSFPVPGGLADRAPQTIALWSLSETTGAWVEEGTASLVTDGSGKLVYRARIRHMSWWNCDRFLDRITCLRGCVTLDGKPAPFAQTQAEGIDYTSLGQDSADKEGCFTEDVKAGAQLRVRALQRDAVSEWKVITASDELKRASDDPTACQDVGTLELVKREVADAGCPTGTTKCGDTCVDLGTDFDNCGSCSKSCFGTLSGSQCIDSTCSCDASETECPTRDGMACTDVNFDESNCGACGKLCAIGQICEAGACKQLDCTAGLTLCGTACVDTTDNGRNCGDCDVACAMGETCNGGKCEALGCATGSEACGNECVAEGQCAGAVDCNKVEMCPSDKTPVSACKVCDGQADCPNGEDEAPRGGDGPCVACKNGSIAWGCNGIKDCPDGEDELNCGDGGSGMGSTCGEKQFGCANSDACFPSEKWCDKTPDCPDGSDEKNCGSVCGPNQFGCANSDACFPSEKWCDKTKDCPDGSDEQQCGGLCAGQQQCPNGSCVDDLSKCPPIECPPKMVACPNGYGCANTLEECPLSCAKGQILCDGIKGGQVCATQCDSVPECGEARDEQPYMCCEQSGGMWCQTGPDTGVCVPAANVCDGGKPDCPNGQDEEPSYCCGKQGGMYCSSGESMSCVAAKSVCAADGAQCNNGQDEDPATCCERNQGFHCPGSLECVSISQVCNGGAPDCKDGSDESLRTCGCPNGDALCADGIQCVSPKLMCNGGTPDCKDGSDEGPRRCGCPNGAFLCGDGKTCAKEPIECAALSCETCSGPECCGLPVCKDVSACGELPPPPSCETCSGPECCGLPVCKDVPACMIDI